MRDPAITHPSATIYLGDCLDVLAEMPSNSVDAIEKGFHAIGIKREADYLPLIQVRLNRLPVEVTA